MRGRDTGMSCDKCSDSQKLYRGCEDAPIQPYPDPLDETRRALLSVCPLRFYKDNQAEVNTILKFHKWYKKGFLPKAGSWTEQYYIFTQYMEAVDKAYDFVERKQLEAIEAKTKK